MADKSPDHVKDHYKDHYKDAGVDTVAGDDLVDWLQSSKTAFTHPKGFGRVADGIGGFAGLFSLNLSRFKNPTLVASTDGVGTKLLLGLDQKMCADLGQDLVAMCVNDLYTVGAVPLFFLDYYATGALNKDQFKQVLTSIQSSCKTCDMALLGGETAEMPGLYEKGHFDLAGFVVGAVDGDHRLGPHRVRVGDKLVAFEASGFHSNGYSLVRKWLLERPRPDLAESLMRPTKLYSQVPELFLKHPDSFHALANITGGGISGNLPRVIAPGQAAEIEFSKLPTPAWMEEFICSNGVSTRAVEEVFNLGAGMIAVVDGSQCEDFIMDAGRLGLHPHLIGEIKSTSGPAVVTYV
jgi:phosphoribosylformylglycinamidine cyclo-ligase